MISTKKFISSLQKYIFCATLLLPTRLLAAPPPQENSANSSEHHRNKLKKMQYREEKKPSPSYEIPKKISSPLQRTQKLQGKIARYRKEALFLSKRLESDVLSEEEKKSILQDYKKKEEAIKVAKKALDTLEQTKEQTFNSDKELLQNFSI